jgi:hypothetical protein
MDNLRECHVEVLNEMNLKFNIKLEEINAKFIKMMNLC